MMIFNAAMHVHFRTKKREHVTKANDSYDATLNRQRKRSRLNTKTTLRKKTLRESSSINEKRKGKYFEIISRTLCPRSTQGLMEKMRGLTRKHLNCFTSISFHGGVRRPIH
ncbi:predicted protein [Nematostella vectensis]|uniref:Uncharacterized protein n=1 Tax=Nematostella vectensis TaxID=45351 RepID=A7SRH7_NEMVE|nr:uncharacterized protein LOC5504921 [Nematostella vectensis]EDO33694.1 predicted protein [Nematostella vectensis]|eukprot:XP_001625794.1 predicted protein [Nematostella vectensis]